MKIQKIMIDAGFTCPNRDGRISTGGCSFCRTDSFSPAYCKGSITAQLEAGKRFFEGKYPDMKYCAFFQSYSNTYAPLEVLRERYEEALAVKDVVGLAIATRPDCLPDETVDYLQQLSRTTQLRLEIGIESLYDKTLKRIGRGHDAETSRKAIARCHAAGLELCIHLILGLPGETEEEMLQEAEMLNQLPIRRIKLHQLQILQGTRMERDWREHPQDFLPLTAERYTHLLAAFIARLRSDILIERYASSAPPALLIYPKWGLKPQQIQEMTLSHLRELTEQSPQPPHNPSTRQPED